MIICEKQKENSVDLKFYKDKSSKNVLLCMDYYACKLYGKYTFAIPKDDMSEFYLFDFESDKDDFLLIDKTHDICGRTFLSIKTENGADIYEVVSVENGLRLVRLIENAFRVKFSSSKIYVITTFMTKLLQEDLNLFEKVIV